MNRGGDAMGQNMDRMRFVRYKRFLIFDFLRLSPENIIHPISTIEKLFCLELYNRFYYILQFFTNTKNNDHG